MTKERKRNLVATPPKKVGESKHSMARRNLVHYATMRSHPNTYCYTVVSRYIKTTSDAKKITCAQCLHQYNRKHPEVSKSYSVIGGDDDDLVIG